jgi:beta-1,4-mannosyltransferase
VLHAIRPPSADTTYATQMRDGAPAQVTVKFFDWRYALHGDYDVLHVHWPEFLVRGGSKKDALLALWRLPRLMRRLRRRKVAVVRTLHNLTPHERGRHPLESWLTKRLDRLVTRYIALNEATETSGLDADLILHGDYIQQFAQYERSSRVPGRVLYFGLVRPYKGIDSLIDAFNTLADPALSLRVVGRPNSSSMRESVEEAAAANAHISVRLEFVSDAELVSEVSAADLIVLPYREMHNSGSLLVALSLGRRVLTLDTPSNRALANEIGDEWLSLYSGELTPKVLADAVSATRRRDEGETDSVPRFRGRTWQDVGLKHYATYLRALKQTGA